MVPLLQQRPMKPIMMRVLLHDDPLAEGGAGVFVATPGTKKTPMVLGSCWLLSLLADGGDCL